MARIPALNQPQVLIATLGSEPQVVTAALDLIKRQGVTIQQLSIIHTTTTQFGLAEGLERLRQALTQPPYQGRISVSYHPVESDSGAALADIDNLEAAQAFFCTLYRLARQAKQAGQTIHLSIAGGRKTMALYGMLTAQLLFDENDRLWYLVSGGDFLSSKRLRPRPGDQVALVQVPVILWSQVSPVFSQLKAIDDPFAAIERVQALRLGEKADAARVFILGSLSPAERRVVELLVREGLSDQAIARRLSLSARTVEAHLRSAYAKAGERWDMPEVTRSQLITLLQLYYSSELREIPHDRLSID
jgi:CRISPR-associated Csx14 family protein